MEVLNESIYDHPRWYDMVFGADCASEVRFILDCAKQHYKKPVKRLLEPACGTGRLMAIFAKRGYHIGGLDINERAIEFCNERLKRLGYRPTAWVGDMTNFEVKQPYDIAFNTINGFRHLATETAATDHLVAMAGAVKTGGLYILGFHLTPTEGIAEDSEAWSVGRGYLSIQTSMWPIEKLPRKRQERFGIRFDIRTPTRHLQINDELRLRSYTAAQAMQLIKRVKEWEVAETYDFHYDLRKPVEIGPHSEDVVFVLRKVK